ALKLRAIGTVSLAGVRRADLESYLARELAKYLRNPVVHAHVLVRVAILGEVEHPGFYAVPADLVLGDALMRAGGPTRDSRVARATRQARPSRRCSPTCWSPPRRPTPSS